MKREKPLPGRLGSRIGLWIGIALICGPFPATRSHAHPHVFIVQRLAAEFDADGLAGIRVRWRFDEMFSSLIAEDHDRNRNGILEPSEVRGIEEQAFSFISEYGYFLSIAIDGTPFPVTRVTDFDAILENGRLSYEFFVPCPVPAGRRTVRVTVGTYDPTYYSAIFFAKHDPVSLSGDEGFEVNAAVREDLSTKIYFDMIHPWALFLEFRRKP